MISLNDYLYSGDTVLRILHKYSADLREDSIRTHNGIDLAHANFLVQLTELLEHNDFLTYQSQQIRKFYNYMVVEYPYLAFTFRGRIKSLIRAEQKFNGYIVEYIYNYYHKNGTFPNTRDIKDHIGSFRDLIAYRIVISMPKCHLEPGDDREEIELDHLYEIANKLPDFLEEQGFTVRKSGHPELGADERLKESVRPYYRDYIHNPSQYGYRSLHVTFYDNVSRNYFEMQLRTKEMDDHAEIGSANHLGYEKRQMNERTRRDEIPAGMSLYFDEAYERGSLLNHLDLSGVEVNMFGAVSNSVMNDGCGLYRGRLILPFEHLSRFQNDGIISN